MSDFETAIRTAAEKSILKIILEGSWIAPDYANRFKLPPEFMQEVYGLIDRDSLKKALAARLETELTDRIVNRLAEEISTDIKQILSVKERREALREVARKHVLGLVDSEPSK